MAKGMRLKLEQVVAKLREIEAKLTQGKDVVTACRKSGATDKEFRDQFLNGELFCSLNKARILIELWRIHYNTVQPHRSIGRWPPAPASWAVGATTHHALHQSLFPSSPTPREVSDRLNLH